MKPVLAWLDWLFDDTEDPAEPVYDPVQLGGAVLVTFTAMGLLYWLLWTLLVFEGGFFAKIGPALSVLLTSKTVRDYGYEGPWNRGVFEGWFGNSCAFLLALAVLAAVVWLYRDAARRSSPRSR